MLTFYPLKTNRFGLYVGPLPSRPGVDYKKIMLFGRSWLAIGCVGAFLLVFGAIELSVINQVVKAWQDTDELFGLVVAIFTVCWLIGWSIGVIFLLIVFLVISLGHGVLLVGQGRVEVLLGIPGFGLVIRQEASEITTIELVDPDPKSVFPKEGKQLLISDASSNKTSPIGSNMRLADLMAVRAAVDRNKGIDAKLDPEDQIIQPRKLEAASNVVADKLLETDTQSSSIVVLVIANLVPLIGALMFGWELSEIMVLYWAETGVILLYQIAKHFVMSPVLGVLASIFSLASVGAFMAMHLLFVWEIFVKQSFNSDNVMGSDLVEVLEYFGLLSPALAALMVSHGYSFFTNFWPRRELYRINRLKIRGVMDRVVLMHITLIFGAFLVFVTNSGSAGALLLIVLKVGADILAHRKHHKPKLSE